MASIFSSGTINVSNALNTVAFSETLPLSAVGGILIVSNQLTYYTIVDSTTITPAYAGPDDSSASFEVIYDGTTKGLSLSTLPKGLINEQVIHNKNLNLIGITMASRLALRPLYGWNFNSGVEGWTTTDCSFAYQDDSYARYTSTDSSHYISSPTLTIPDAETWPILMMRYRRVSGETEFSGAGIINFTGSSSDNYWYPNADGGWHFLVIDLANDIENASDWTGSSITSLSIGFPNQTYTSGVSWDVDFIGLCQFGLTGLSSTGSSGSRVEDVVTNTGGNTFTNDTYNYVPGTIEVYWQGARQHSSNITENYTSGYVSGFDAVGLFAAHESDIRIVGEVA